MPPVTHARTQDCKYVLFVDMGCRMNPGTLQALVHEMETDQRCFVATGFPFDVPPPQVRARVRAGPGRG